MEKRNEEDERQRYRLIKREEGYTDKLETNGEKRRESEKEGEGEGEKERERERNYLGNTVSKHVILIANIVIVIILFYFVMPNRGARLNLFI